MSALALQMSLFSPRWYGDNNEVLSPPYRDPFLASCEQQIKAAGAARLQFDEETWDHTKRGAVGVDVESFYNFFVICFKRFIDGKRIAFESSHRSTLDNDFLLSVLNSNTLISFNGISYDLPMIYLALGGARPHDLKVASDKIILEGIRTYEIVRVPRLNHIDLIEPNPSIKQGLKMLNGRLHGRFMVDLPFSPDATLTPEQMNIATLYCMNDLEVTELTYKSLREPLELRVALGKKYGGDFRSKSDSQIGEAIVKRRVEETTRRRVEKRVHVSPLFQYKIPKFIKFESGQLQNILDQLDTTSFTIEAMGKVTPPEFLRNLQVHLGNMTYSMGIGGIHSTEAHRALRSNETHFLMDVDVASQYPRIITNLGLYPPALGPGFLKIYGELIEDRLAAKAAGDKIRADGGRIALNGVFGKLGSPYSSLYAPELLIAITLTGQLAILMLIERAEAAGIPVVSANTDGVVFNCPQALETRLNEILIQWETDTGFTIERTPYRALYSSSVNTYIAVREDGKVKRKGYIADPWKEGDLRGQMMKNPQMTICAEAVERYITHGISIEETIRNCKDPRQFLTVVKVTGGAKWRDHPLGRAIRYYWSSDSDPILYIKSKNKVPKTDGAKPLLELTGTLPPDIDYVHYFEESVRIATDLGIRF